jgi:hypothetical protein
VQAIAPVGPFGGGSLTPFEVTYAGPAPYLVSGTSQINLRAIQFKGTIFVHLPPAQSNGFQIYVAAQ